jgi:hypothetical protein
MDRMNNNGADELRNLARVVKQMQAKGVGFTAEDVALIASTRADVLDATDSIRAQDNCSR